MPASYFFQIAASAASIAAAVHAAAVPTLQALDSDKKRLQAPDGRKAARDMVQFVELRPNQVCAC